ncbi:MAG: HlyC/CorC family transporter [Spirochaetia bacterium]|nr:HlyC/CorC family transporter [Spirochaetia bacterium]
MIDIFIIVIFLILSAFFSGSETAFTSLSSFQADKLAENGGKRGKILKDLYDKQSTFIATVLICNNLVNIGLSAFVTQYTIELWGDDVLGYVTGALTLLVLIFGEVTPKNIAMVWNEPIALFIAPIFKVLSIILYPVIIVINACSSFITRLVGNREKDEFSPDIIYSLISSAANKGLVQDYERRMTRGVFNMSHTTVKNIMTHRTDVVSMDQESTMQDVIDEVDKHKFARYPIYSEDNETITGFVRSSKIVSEIRKNHLDRKIKEIKDRPLFIPDTRKISDVFRQMKEENIHFAIVLDEYGGLAGIVTLEDIVNSVLGDIDNATFSETERIEKISDKEYVIYGEAPISTVSDTLRIDLPWDDRLKTIGGLITKKMARIPVSGEKVTLGKHTFIIEDASDRQVLKVRYKR